MNNGLIIAAPASGSGKTTVTLALLRLLARQGLPVRGAKSGPDFIDPRFHEAASGAPCVNLDAWAMHPARLRTLAGEGAGLLVVEGAMGLFDGAPGRARRRRRSCAGTRSASGAGGRCGPHGAIGRAACGGVCGP